MATILDLEQRIQYAQDAADAALARGDFIAASRHQNRANKTTAQLTKVRAKEGES